MWSRQSRQVCSGSATWLFSVVATGQGSPNIIDAKQKNIGHREPEPLSGYLNNRYTQCGYHMLMHKAEVMRKLNRLCLRGLRKCHAMETVI